MAIEDVNFVDDDNSSDNMEKRNETVDKSRNKRDDEAFDMVNSMYYLYRGETGTSGAITPVLAGHNFISWERQFWLQLSFRNKTCFIDGSISEPEKGTKEHDAWRRCNNIILSWLINSVETEIGNSIMHCSTVKEAWDRLKLRYSKQDNVRVYELQYKLGTLGQGTLTVSDYFSAVSAIWEEITKHRPLPTCICGKCTCNVSGKVAANMKVDKLFQFLMGLNNVFNSLRGSLIAKAPLPDVNTAFQLVSQEERQQQVRQIPHQQSSQMDTAAFAVQNRYNKGDGGIPVCTYCNKKGHGYEKCYKRIGYPPGHKLHNRVSQGFAGQDQGYPAKKPAYNTGRSFTGSGSTNAGNKNFVANVVSAEGDKLDMIKCQLQDLFTEIEQIKSQQCSASTSSSPAQVAHVISMDPSVAYSNLAGNFHKESDWDSSKP